MSTKWQLHRKHSSAGQGHSHDADVPAFQLVPPAPEAFTDFVAESKKPGFVGLGNFRDKEAPKSPKPPPEEKALEHNDNMPDDDEPSGNKVNLPKLKAIFNWVVGETTVKLANINDALVKFNVDPVTGLAAYEAAKGAFEDWVKCLDNPHPFNHLDPSLQGKCNGVTMKWASIEPVEGNGGFVVGARIVVRWNGGSHSSSSSVP